MWTSPPSSRRNRCSLCQVWTMAPPLRTLWRMLAGRWFYGPGSRAVLREYPCLSYYEILTRICWLNRDLNNRIEQRRGAVISNIQAGKLSHLLQYDQLLHEMHTNPTFRLRTFTEPPITFAPTYKYDRYSTIHDSSDKRRIPDWYDRILYRSRDPSRIENLWYGRYEPDVSDHRPVYGAYRAIVKKVAPGERAKELTLVRRLLEKESVRLCAEMRGFYEGQ
jgi:hypothetical protein